ncbi:MAG: GNAT family N-acetyltransferase [Paracoccaceae bacterium]
MLTIRALNPDLDLPSLRSLYAQVSDFWMLSDGHPADEMKVAAFFTDTPPGCDPAASHRLGLMSEDGQLGGVAVLSFGFPTVTDAYIDLMVLAPYLRGQGHGTDVVRMLESRARASGARGLYLAVLGANPRGWAFWSREGFHDTGHSGIDPDSGQRLHRLGKAL